MVMSVVPDLFTEGKYSRTQEKCTEGVSSGMPVYGGNFPFLMIPRPEHML